MNIALTGLLLWLSAVELLAGTELQYTGTVSRQEKDGATEVKAFSLSALTLTADDGQTQLACFLDERGGGGWGWPERLGLNSIGNTGNPPSRPIRLLYSHVGQNYSLPVRSPLFESPEKLVPQTSWADGRYEFVVTRKRKVKDRDCFQVEVSSNIGKVQTLVIEASSGILLSLDERVIIGRGDEFQLKMDLQSQSLLSAADLAKSRQAWESLLAVKSELGRTGEQMVFEPTADQLNLLRKELPRLERESEGTVWSAAVATIGRDLKQQQKRVEGVAGMQKKFVGQPAPDWTLKLTDGSTISHADVEGKVVVLHFWQYRGEPLVEPYGQVGYLDYLYSKRKKLGIRVIGVNLDERYATAQKAVATRSMKSLIEFMKLSYDLAIDDGSVLAEFGDPRAIGAPLPLWVVIGHDGKIVHHFAGVYDIKPDEGLKQLEDAVIAAVRRQNEK